MLSYNERQRRLWAAEQIPQLVTNDQALEMFGHRSFDRFRDYLTYNGVDSYTNPRWPNSRFYDRKQTELVAAKYLEDNPARIERANMLKDRSEKDFLSGPTISTVTPKPAKKKGELNTFEKFIPDVRWTKDQFLDYWDGQINHGAASDILDRAPSIYRMKSFDAFALVKILTSSKIKEYGGIKGYRSDKLIFSRAVYNYAKTADEKKRLMAIVMDLYSKTDLGKLPPFEVVAVIYELVCSSQ